MTDRLNAADDGGAGEWLDGLSAEQLAALDAMVASAQQQIDDGQGVAFNVDDIIARGRARRAARAAAE